MSMDVFRSPLELKFSAAGHGQIEGYGAVFGNIDSHGDVIEPGAFRESLAERAKAGRPFPPMRKMHGVNSFDPIGVWEEMREDSRGLFVKGRLIGLDTEIGRRNYAMVRDGALRGLSIGYKVKRARAGRGTVKRHLESVHLSEVSLVDEPSNPAAVVTGVKSAGAAFGGRPIIEGFATLWHRVHAHPTRGGLEVFARHAFTSTVGGAPVQLLIDHNGAKRLAGVDSGLHLFTTDDGLAFRAELLPGPFVDEALAMIARTGQAGMSVGYREEVSHERLIEGVKVKVIERAELREISLVTRGAVDQAFAVLSEHSPAEWRQRAATKALLADGAAAKLMHELSRFSERIVGGLG